MSYFNNNHGPPNTVRRYGEQKTSSRLNISSTPSMSSCQPKTPMVYSHTLKMQRNNLTESEPLSPYSEMQIPFTQIQSNQQLLTPMPNRTYFRSEEAILQNQLSPFSPVTNAHPQNLQSKRLMDTKLQRIVDVRASPYARSNISHYQTQQSLLPSPKPQKNITAALSYNPDQFFVMRSTSSSNNTDWNMSSDMKRIEDFGSTKINTANAKTALPNAKVTPMSRKRFLIGCIDQIINWNKMAKKLDLYIIYEVTGILESVSYNPKAKVYNMVIRDDHKMNSVLQAVFFPIDRGIPDVQTGSLIIFVGRMIGARKLQVLNMQSTDANSLAGLKRISFLCQRALQEFCLSSPES